MSRAAVQTDARAAGTVELGAIAVGRLGYGTMRVKAAVRGLGA